MKLKIISLIILVFFAACSGSDGGKKIVVVGKKKPVYDAPQVQASLKTSPAIPLVSDGIALLKEGNLSSAEWNFEEAINLDPDFGPSYYWLARAQYKFKKATKALSLLDKAEQLLGFSKTWMKRIKDFRSHIRAEIAS